LDASTAKAATPAPGSADPKDGQFGSGGGAVGGGGGGSVSGPSSTVIYKFADGSFVTQTTTVNADGSITVNRVYSNGETTSENVPAGSGGDQGDLRLKTGQLSWREMIRP